MLLTYDCIGYLLSRLQEEVPWEQWYFDHSKLCLSPYTFCAGSLTRKYDNRSPIKVRIVSSELCSEGSGNDKRLPRPAGF